MRQIALLTICLLTLFMVQQANAGEVIDTIDKTLETIEQSKETARLWVHVRSDKQEGIGNQILNRVKDTKLKERRIERKPIQVVKTGPRTSELRYFKRQDESEAQELFQILIKLIPQLELKDLSSQYDRVAWIKSGHYELWLSTDLARIEGPFTGKDGAPMVLVPSGEFTMGSDMGTLDEKPLHKVYLDAYYIDKYEVTTARYAAFMRESGRGKPRDWNLVNLKSQGDRPVVGVTWDDAKAYCNKYGKRLPTEAEWEKAARGTDGRTYPWGNEPLTSRHANFDNCCDFMSYGVLTAVGSLNAGKSPYGAYDMAGNVYEWVADWYDKNYYKNSPRKNPRGPSNGKYRVVRGGSWSDVAGYLRAAYRDYVDWPSNRGNGIGFRCAQDAR